MILVRQIVRVFLFLFALIVVCAQMVGRHLYPKDPHVMARLWHRLCMRAFGVRVHTEGEIADGPVLFLANHVSHLDISVLGGLTPLRFVSKQEVRSWPVFGELAKLQDTIFIDRSATLPAMRAARAQVQQALNRQYRLVIFPEGTNTIGDKVLPFRRALLDGVEANGYKIQPVAIECVAVDGQPLAMPEDFEIYGWGDVSFALHLWRVMGHRNLDVRVTFLPPLTVGESGEITRAQVDAAGQAVKSLVEGNLPSHVALAASASAQN